MASWEIQARLAQPRILPAENSKIKPAQLFLYKHFRQKELREHTMQNTREKDRPRERIKQHWSPYWWRRKGMTGDDCKIMYYWRQHPHWRWHSECMMSCHTLVRVRLHYIIPLSLPSLLDFIKSGVSNWRQEYFATSVCWLLSFYWTLLRRVWLFLFCTFPLNSQKTTAWSPTREILVSHEHIQFFLPLLVCHVLQLAPCHLAVLPAALTPLSQYLSCTGKFYLDTAFLMQTHKCQVEEKISSLDMLVVLVLIHPCMQCNTVDLFNLSLITSQSFPTSQPSCHLVLSTYNPSCRALYLPLLNFMRFLSTLFHSLSRSS